MEIILEHISITFSLFSNPKEAYENNKEYIGHLEISEAQKRAADKHNFNCYRQSSVQ